MNLTQKTMMLMTLAVAAFGADRKLGFQAEFPFTVGSVPLPAGAYVIERTTTVAPVVTLRNLKENKSVIVQFATVAVRPEGEGKATIQFRCGNSGCAVAEVNQLVAGTAHIAFSPKVKDTKAKLISLNLKPVAAE